jgi:hypothetical protein
MRTSTGTSFRPCTVAALPDVPSARREAGMCLDVLEQGRRMILHRTLGANAIDSYLVLTPIVQWMQQRRSALPQTLRRRARMVRPPIARVMNSDQAPHLDSSLISTDCRADACGGLVKPAAVFGHYALGRTRFAVIACSS